MKGHKNEGNKSRTGHNIKKYQTLAGNNVEYNKRRKGHIVLNGKKC